jgi:hypothetical protein
MVFWFSLVVLSLVVIVVVSVSSLEDAYILTEAPCACKAFSRPFLNYFFFFISLTINALRNPSRFFSKKVRKKTAQLPKKLSRFCGVVALPYELNR